MSESRRSVQVTVVMLCLLANVAAGFDTQALVLTSTRILAEWNVGALLVGRIFDAGLLGVAIGSFALSPLGDRFGRRAAVLGGLIMATLGVLPVGLVHTPAQLTAMTFLTGLGTGLLLPGLNTIVCEYVPGRWRGPAVSLYATGYPVGAILSGVLGPYLIARYGWRSVYVAGGLLSLVLTGLVAAWMRESAAFLALPADRPKRTHPLTPFEGSLRRPTILVGSAFVALWITLFFMNNWIPAILAREGLTTSQASRAGVMLSFGGLFGSALVGFVALRLDLVRVCTIFLVACFVLTVFFGLSGVDSAVMWVCAVLGFLMFAASVGLYVVVADIYPPQARAAGTGLAFALGRLGEAVGIFGGGYLFTLGWPRSSYVGVMAMPLLAAAVATYALVGRARVE
ncbi:MAG TPA: MFS transporter [Steroidobacteraceae bacterium]|jgi:MFS family permease